RDLRDRLARPVGFELVCREAWSAPVAMAAYTDFFPQLAAVSGLLLAALVAAPLVARIRLPGPAAFLAVGIVAGLAGIAPTGSLAPRRLEQIGTVLLYLILFDGGLTTGLAAFRRAA